MSYEIPASFLPRLFLSLSLSLSLILGGKRMKRYLSGKIEVK
jgi:hypothetical protein